MRYKDLLETPIEDVSLHGEISPDSDRFDAVDRNLISNPKWREKLKGKWANTKIPVYVTFVDKNLLGINDPDKNTSYVFTPEQFSEVEKKYNIDIPIYPNAINAVFTKNLATKKMPMSSWIIAHRLGEVSYFIAEPFHAKMRTKNTKDEDILPAIRRKKGYEWAEMTEKGKNIFLDFLHFAFDKLRYYFFVSPVDIHGGMQGVLTDSILTMRSARIKHPTVYIDYELELFAQYMVTGDIKFDLDNGIAELKKHKVKGEVPDSVIQEIRHKLEETKKELIVVFDEFVEGAKGKVLVY